MDINLMRFQLSSLTTAKTETEKALSEALREKKKTLADKLENDLKSYITYIELYKTEIKKSEENAETVRIRKGELTAEEEKIKEELEKQERKLKKREKKESELKQRTERFERMVKDAYMTKDFSDLLLMADMPDQAFTTAVEVKLKRILEWKRRQQVRLERLEKEAESYRKDKANLASKIQNSLTKLGPEYSVEEMAKAIAEFDPEDSDDDDFSKNRDSDDEDMPIKVSDEQGFMPEEGGYETPYNYLVRLKQKYIWGNETSGRQLNVLGNQITELHQVIKQKILGHDKQIKDLAKKFKIEITELQQRIDAKDFLLKEMSATLRRASEFSLLERAMQKNIEKVASEKNEAEKKSEGLRNGTQWHGKEVE